MDGKRIRELREAKQLKQVQLARAAQVPQSHLSAVEAGRRGFSIDALKRIAVALEVSVDDLLTAA